MRVVLYGKPGCSLCDLAESRLRAIRARRPFDLLKVDILGDPALEARFGTTIPAVEVDGAIVSEGRFDEKAVERAVGVR
jgi:hypothetical protein